MRKKIPSKYGKIEICMKDRAGNTCKIRKNGNLHENRVENTLKIREGRNLHEKHHEYRKAYREKEKANMTKELKTTIQHIEAAPGQRILVVSDIHGHFNYLVQLLKKMEYSGDDILVIVGDLIDKGPESLRVVQYVMDLCRQHPVYVSAGNVDMGRLWMIENDSQEEAENFIGNLKWNQEYWESSFCQEMLSDIGISLGQLTTENVLDYKRKMKEHFQEELEFLRSRPVILTAGKYLFVHGGVPTDDLTELEGTDAKGYLKNDDFFNQGYQFQNYTVVTGHWPTCLYRQEYEDVSPLFDREKGIICIDGGCGLKKSGQLNGIVLPDCMADIDEISWTCYDKFPIVKAIDKQEGKRATSHIQYFDNQVEILESQADYADEEKSKLCTIRHISTGKILEAPRKWISDWNDKVLHCDDYCNADLQVEPGEMLSVLFEAGEKRYVKSHGKIGWYYGKVESVNTKLELVEGAPQSGNWRRERELAVYRLLDNLGIAYERIDHSEANTMEACQAVDEALNAVICKNLFLCNQQRTKFYLLMMPEGKKFKTKELSKQINSARLSFAEAKYMEEFLHITPGSVSVMGLMNDKGNRVQLLIDKDVLKGERFGCHPCMNTSSIRMHLKDLLERFLSAVHHDTVFVELVGED